MKETRLLMGMPITVEIADAVTTDAVPEAVFALFDAVDRKFSTYKTDSEISQINRGELAPANASREMQQVFALAEQTRRETDGYFDIQHAGMVDPSGIVKGWAIAQAAELLRRKGFKNFYVDAGGDIQTAGKNQQGERWRVGIRNPFNMDEIVKTIEVSDGAVATSGTSIRGQHIYNPQDAGQALTEIVSLTVLASNILDADRFATAAFAMGPQGIYWLERREGLEGYMIDRNGLATFTSGFNEYVLHD